MREREAKSRVHAKTLRRTLTKAEAVLWSRLKARNLNGHHFRRQHPIGPFIADFACVEAKLILEVDGATHMSADDQVRDLRRTAFLESEGWLVMRVWNNQVYENRDGVLRAIDEIVTARIGAKMSSPRASGGGGPEGVGGGDLE
jgi:very-short-patch-repair endonuclease